MNTYTPHFPEDLLQVTTEYTYGQLFMYTQVSPDENCTERYTTKTNSSLNNTFILTVDSVLIRTMIMS